MLVCLKEKEIPDKLEEVADKIRSGEIELSKVTVFVTEIEEGNNQKEHLNLAYEVPEE